MSDASGSGHLAHWKRVADDLGIEVVGPIEVELPSGARIQAPVIVRNFGGRNGMILVSDYRLIKELSDEIVEAGYGFSVMSEPKPGSAYERDVAIDVLSDWGWWGPESEPPSWLRHVNREEEDDG